MTDGNVASIERSPPSSVGYSQTMSSRGIHATLEQSKL
jgi:hypothetical protein